MKKDKTPLPMMIGRLKDKVKIIHHRRDMREDIMQNGTVPEIPRKNFRKEKKENG